MSSFVHLHVHSEYSLLDGACRVDALCRRSAEDGAPGIALTDHGVMFGAMEFYYAARDHSLVPIVGCEAYIAPRGRFDRTVRDEAHVTLLAADLVGYRNLVALISKGFLEGYYYKPRIDLDLLAEHHDGLIVLSGCMSGLCAQPLLKNDYEGAKKAAKTFHEIFGDRFYVEIMRHGIPEQDAVNDGLIKLARELNLPLVATNDSHYLKRDDAPAHDVLLCIGTGKTVSDTGRLKFYSEEFYVKSPEEMRALFADVPDACDNTLEIVKRIDIRIPEKTFYLPEYPVPTHRQPSASTMVGGAPASGPPASGASTNGSSGRGSSSGGSSTNESPEADSSLNRAAADRSSGSGSSATGPASAASTSAGRPTNGASSDRARSSDAPGGAATPRDDGRATEQTDAMTPEAYLREICERGLIERYGAERAANDRALRERFEYELDVITKMGFASYFLIVWDFIKFARDRDIPVGPGRGSAVGSVVSYCLRITDIDPIKYNLIFERFLNPDRISMPDIDTDFCVERRNEVIEYVAEKYGKDRVAQIVTFGTMAARAAVRDAGRALGIPLADVDRVAKLIPSGPNGLSIEEALQQIPELKRLYDGSPPIRKLLDTANSIEGLARHASTHAAGVVISKGPLVDHAPLIKLGEDDVNTQYSMGWVEKIGLLKMDFLGLRNLTVMKNAVDEIRRTVDPGFDLAKIPDNDQRTLEMLGRGETTGVFQLESDGMRRVVTELKPTCIEDIVAVNALYRPGPMDWIPQYIANKHGRSKPKYLHPKLEPILSETYGIACLRVGTPIWYADGTMKPIEDVRPGDEILTFDDGVVRPARAAKAWPSGKKPLLRITLSTGTVIECSEDHRFPTPAGDLMARDLRVNSAYRRRAAYAYAEVQSILFESWLPPRSTPADRSIGGCGRAYLLGLLVGDGSLKCHGSKSITCGSRDDAEVVAALFRAEFACDTRVYFNTRAWYVRPVFHTAPKPTPLTTWLDEIYAGRDWQQHCARKQLPKMILQLRESERVALLRGLWDSDGTYGRIHYFRSTSPRLLRQVAALLASLKIAFYVRPTAVFIQDKLRFTDLVGGPTLPSKPVAAEKQRNAMPVLAASLRGVVDSSSLRASPIVRRWFAHVKGRSFVKVTPTSAYLRKIPAFWSAYRKAYEELYLGDTRPVFIETIEDAGIDDCVDVQMEDQSSPYFIANGVSTHNCYQEQVMQIARDVAGFTMGQADELRKVMGKKLKDKIPVYREKFINGAAENGVDPKLADEIFQFIEPFAGYGFNKSHAVAYGWISYQTAFLKANYPVQYFTALMTSVKDKTDKLVEYIDEAKRIGIAVLPPDVNESLVDFTVSGEQIRFGLAAIKGVGEGAVQSLLDARARGGPFTDLFDLTRRVEGKQVNRRVFEALIKCGALDALPGNRAQLLAALESAMEVAARASRDRELGQASLFGVLTAAEPTAALRPPLPDVAPPTTMQQLAWEKETLGIFVSGHPLADVTGALARTGALPIKQLREVEDDAAVTVAGMLTGVRRTLTKAQQEMLIATLEDTTGGIECIVFPRQYEALHAAFVPDAIVAVKGRLRSRERRGGAAAGGGGDEVAVERSVQVMEVAPVERRANGPAPPGWHVEVQRRTQVDALARLMDESPGTVPIVLHHGDRSKHLPRGISADPYVRAELARIFGEANVREGRP